MDEQNTLRAIIGKGFQDLLGPLIILGVCIVGGAMITIATTANMFPFLAAIIVFLILCAVAFIHLEKFLLVVVLFSILVPIDVAIRTEGLPRIGPTRIIFAAFVCGWFFRLLTGGKKIRLTELPVMKYVLIFLAANLVSAFFSIIPRRSVFALLSLSFEQILLFYMVYQFMKNPSFRAGLKKTILWATAAACCFGVYELFTHQNPFLQFYPEGELAFRGGLLRVQSVFFHSIAFGCFLNLVVPFVMVDLFGKSSMREKIVSGLLLMVMLLMLFCTISRGPWMGFIIQIMVFMGIWGKERISRLLSAIIIIGLLGTITLLSLISIPDTRHLSDALVNPNRISIGKIHEESSEYYRIALWKAVLEKLEGAKWIYGLGPGTFYLADIEASYAGHSHTLTAADCHYAKVLAESGILGLAAFLILMSAVCFQFIRAIKRSIGNERLFMIWGLAAVVGFLFENITVSMFDYLPLSLLFWILVAAACQLRTRSEARFGI